MTLSARLPSRRTTAGYTDVVFAEGAREALEEDLKKCLSIAESHWRVYCGIVRSNVPCDLCNPRLWIFRVAPVLPALAMVLDQGL